MSTYPRVAFLPDTFSEVNGVAHTARHLEAFARRRQIPFLSVHAGPQTAVTTDGAVTVMELRRSWAKLGLDANLDYDLLLMRYANRLVSDVANFGAELIHITGPGDMGAVGAYVSWRLKLPLVISWHTSLHEYAGTRLERLLQLFGPRIAKAAGIAAERWSLQILRWFYRRAVVTMAPNEELLELTRKLTNRPVFLMRRGVDAQLFNPARRHRTDAAFRIGYVGRLTPEKDVRFLAAMSAALEQRGLRNVQFVVVGEGSEEAWLRKHIPNASFTGVLRGEALAQAYADMDLFAFPSRTDTFGNVVLEALASGVPAVVTDEGGPKFIVQQDVTGHVASSREDFIAFAAALVQNPERHRALRSAALAYANSQSWDAVFETVFRAYREGIDLYRAAHPLRAPLLSSRVHARHRS